MTGGRQLRTAIAAAFAALTWLAGEASAAQCGSTSAGFEAWKQQFADEARGRGVGASAVAALMATSYSTAAISASFRVAGKPLVMSPFAASAARLRPAADGR